MGGSHNPLGATIFFISFTIVFSVAVVHEQARSCHNLDLQKNASRVMLLALVYSICSFVGAYTPKIEPFTDIVVAIYEGYALYCFFAMMIISAGGCKRVIPNLIEEPPYVQSVCRIPLCRFEDGERLYKHFRRSVMQVMFTRPFFLAMAAIAAASNENGPAVRVLRVLALFSLVYTVTILAHVYFLLRHQIEGMDTVRSFFVLKGFVLLLTLQDLAVLLILASKKDRWSRENEGQLRRAYALLVSIESLFFIPLIRAYFKPGVFLINADCSTPHGAAVNIPRFWIAVLAFVHVVENGFVRRGTIGKKKEDMSKPINRGVSTMSNSEGSGGEVEVRDVTVVTNHQGTLESELELGIATRSGGCRAYT